MSRADPSWSSTAARRASSSRCSTRPSTPLPRKPMWAGQVEGIGGTSADARRSAASPPAAVVLDADKPYHAALQHVRATRRSRRPAAGRRRRWCTASCTAAASTRRRCASTARVLADLQGYIALAPLHQPFALQAIEILLAELPDLPQVACFDTAFHRTLPRGGADAAAAARALGARRPALRLPRPVVRVHGRRARRAPRRRSRAGARSSRTWAAARACARCTGSRASPRRWASPRSTA